MSLDRIIDALWGEQPPRRAADNVAVLVSRLRRVLGPGTILGGRSGYTLAPSVLLDSAQAEQLVAEAEARLGAGEAGLAGAAAAAALELLGQGGWAADEEEAWVAPLRTHATTLLTRARHVAAEATLRTGDFAAGRAAAESALAADEFDEVAARQLMLTHVRRGEPARALAVYDSLRSALSSALGVEPAAETRELHLAVLRETPAASVGGAGPRPSSPASTCC